MRRCGRRAFVCGFLATLLAYKVAAKPSGAATNPAADTFGYEIPAWCKTGGGSLSLLVGRDVTLRSELPGPLYSFEVAPELPAGLELDPITGSIHGRPVDVVRPQTYTVVAALGGERLQGVLEFQVAERLPGSQVRTLAGSRELGVVSASGGHGMYEHLEAPTDLYVHGQTLFIAARSVILQLDLTTSHLSVFLGQQGVEGLAGDGLPKEQALVFRPWGMVVLDDELYFADGQAHAIRKVGLTPSSLVTRVAGTGQEGVGGDNVLAVEADIHHPIGLALLDQLLYFTDSFNHCVRAVNLETGMLHTIAGVCGTRGFGYDAEPAAQAQLSHPHGIVAVNNLLFVADWGNRRIRMLNISQDPITVKTIAGAKAPEAPAVDYSWIGPVNLAVSADKQSLFTSATREHLVLEIDIKEWVEKPKVLGKGKVVVGTGKPDEGEPEKEVTVARQTPLNTPRGICVLGSELLVAEYHRVRAVELTSRAKPKTKQKPKGKQGPAPRPPAAKHDDL